MQKAAQAYFQTQVTTTNQGDVVVLLYDGAIKFLNKAKELLAANDMAGKGINISKALDVISELDGSLNLEKGGSLAHNLHGLYSFCLNHLVKANLKKSPEMIDDVIKVLAGLRSAYAEILSMPEAQAAAQEAAANLGAKAITTSRGQSGFCPSGGATPVPGAGARMRAMYAKASEGQCAPAPQEGGQKQAQEPDNTEANAVTAETATQGNTVTPAQGPEQAKSEESPSPTQETPFGGGFSPKLPGAGLYKKYAAMQK